MRPYDAADVSSAAATEVTPVGQFVSLVDNQCRLGSTAGDSPSVSMASSAVGDDDIGLRPAARDEPVREALEPTAAGHAEASRAETLTCDQDRSPTPGLSKVVSPDTVNEA